MEALSFLLQVLAQTLSIYTLVLLVRVVLENLLAMTVFLVKMAIQVVLVLILL